MIKLKNLLLVATLSVLVACSGGSGGGFLKKDQTPAIDYAALPSMRVVAINVVVPKTLRVSESNAYKPQGDIVWHGDPYGDRYKQVKDVVDAGFALGARTIKGNLPVRVDVQISRFHSVSERTRYTFGGSHEVEFLMTVSNAANGDIIIPQHFVATKFKAFGGDEAIAAERVGQTQKVRVMNHLALVLQEQLTGKRFAIENQ